MGQTHILEVSGTDGEGYPISLALLRGQSLFVGRAPFCQVYDESVWARRLVKSSRQGFVVCSKREAIATRVGGSPFRDATVFMSEGSYTLSPGEQLSIALHNSSLSLRVVEWNSKPLIRSRAHSLGRLGLGLLALALTLGLAATLSADEDIVVARTGALTPTFEETVRQLEAARVPEPTPRAFDLAEVFGTGGCSARGRSWGFSITSLLRVRRFHQQLPAAEHTRRIARADHELRSCLSQPIHSHHLTPRALPLSYTFVPDQEEPRLEIQQTRRTTEQLKREPEHRAERVEECLRFALSRGFGDARRGHYSARVTLELALDLTVAPWQPLPRRADGVGFRPSNLDDIDRKLDRLMGGAVLVGEQTRDEIGVTEP